MTLPKKLTLVGTLVTVVFFSVGCSQSLEKTLVEEPPEARFQEMTAVEYSNKITRTIMPLLNDGQTHMTHHLDVVKGKYPIQQEIQLTEYSIDRAQRAIEEVNGLNPPDSYREHKLEAVHKLTLYKDALMRYQSALKTGETDKIKSAADLLKNEWATVNTVSTPYQQ